MQELLTMENGMHLLRAIVVMVFVIGSWFALIKKANFKDTVKKALIKAKAGKLSKEEEHGVYKEYFNINKKYFLARFDFIKEYLSVYILFVLIIGYFMDNDAIFQLLLILIIVMQRMQSKQLIQYVNVLGNMIQDGHKGQRKNTTGKDAVRRPKQGR